MLVLPDEVLFFTTKAYFLGLTDAMNVKFNSSVNYKTIMNQRFWCCPIVSMSSSDDMKATRRYFSSVVASAFIGKHGL